jgi:hypothetical protein
LDASAGVNALTCAAFVNITGASAAGAWASAVSECAQKARNMTWQYRIWLKRELMDQARHDFRARFISWQLFPKKQAGNKLYNLHAPPGESPPQFVRLEPPNLFAVLNIKYCSRSVPESLCAQQ